MNLTLKLSTKPCHRCQKCFGTRLVIVPAPRIHVGPGRSLPSKAPPKIMLCQCANELVGELASEGQGSRSPTNRPLPPAPIDTPRPLLHTLPRMVPRIAQGFAL